MSGSSGRHLRQTLGPWPLSRPATWIVTSATIATLGFVGLHLGYKLGVLQDERFALSTDRGFAEMFMDVQLLATCVLVGAVWWLSRQSSYLLWAAVFGYLLLDDTLRLHERSGIELSALMGEGADGVWYSLGEILPSAIVAVVAVAVIWHIHRRADRLAKATNRLMLGVMVAFAVFGVGVDVLHTAVAESGPRILSGALGVLEDAGEMLTATAAMAIAFGVLSKAREASKVPADT